jgi:hypothetical protein
VYCHDCGTANTVDSKYCKECGNKINDGYRTMMLSVQDLPLDQTEETVDQLTRLLDMAFWHNEAGNWDAAVTASEAVLAINPNSTTAHSLLGTLYEKKGDDAQAIAHFEAVLALNPDSVADATKLDQLRRGVHVKSVAPPISHQLLPPALMKLGPTLQQKWIGLSTSGLRPTAVPRQPLYAAAGVTAGILIVGLLLMRPWAHAETVTTYPIAPVTVPSSVSAGNSAFATGSGSQTQTSAPLPPVVMQGSTLSSPISLTTHDPFAGRLAGSASQTAPNPRWALPSVSSRTEVTRRRHSAGQDVPPLRLAALPAVGSEGLAPAPVTLPEGLSAPIASVAAIPQHTVVINSVAGAPPQFTSQAEQPSHIHITVHQINDTDSNTSSASSGGSSRDGSGRADADQQRALSLQQGGDFKQARTAYQSAIRAYEAQIASGHDVETAQRGLAACQTGLQICQQSQ